MRGGTSRASWKRGKREKLEDANHEASTRARQEGRAGVRCRKEASKGNAGDCENRPGYARRAWRGNGLGGHHLRGLPRREPDHRRAFRACGCEEGQEGRRCRPHLPARHRWREARREG
ncbi:hypothetical protein M9Y10_042389 [Tritrichomonas musculus]|uniref:Uncharacterized protein n=1 Tax=Tritrichomonas musculus TaxID=1915356 RepID=A0ABR2GID9_9EUKA